MARMWLSTTIARSTVKPQRDPDLGVRPDPGRHHQHSHASELPSLNVSPSTRSAPSTSVVEVFSRMFTPIRSIAAFSIAPPWLVELLLHQVLAEMDHGHLAAMGQQPARRLEPEQPAADHRGTLARPGRGDHALRSRRWCGTRTRPVSAAASSRSPVIGGMNARDPVAINSTS